MQYSRKGGVMTTLGYMLWKHAVWAAAAGSHVFALASPFAHMCAVQLGSSEAQVPVALGYILAADTQGRHLQCKQDKSRKE